MRCVFCEQEVLHEDKSLGLPITLPGKGVAHSYCAEADLSKKRIFGQIHLKDLGDEDLVELYELVMAEVNERCQ